MSTPAPPPDGPELWDRVGAILPHRRCITGDGLRATLRALGEHVPIALAEVPTGTEVLDWTVPPEWRVRDAAVSRPDGTRVVDAARSPLHLVQYSAPVQARLPLSALRAHLHTLPDRPDWIPYRTDYYSGGWGFCLRQRTLDALAEDVGEGGELDVRIDSDLFEGSLTYGEVVVPGRTGDEILISAHACHPALANDNAASLVVATALARHLLDGPARRHTVRFVFAPGTIGAIAWLAGHPEVVGRVRHGLVLANLGDAGSLTYKQTRGGTLDGALPVDRAVVSAAREVGVDVDVRPFDPFGYDERQYGSPGFDLPVGRLTRTPHGEYPEYHTSADDLDLVRPEALAESLAVLVRVVERLDASSPATGRPATRRDARAAPRRPAAAPHGPDRRYCNRAPFGEPQLGRRGLYHTADGVPLGADVQAAILWVLNLSDGRHSLHDVSGRSGLPSATVEAAAARLLEADLLDALP